MLISTQIIIIIDCAQLLSTFMVLTIPPLTTGVHVFTFKKQIAFIIAAVPLFALYLKRSVLVTLRAHSVVIGQTLRACVMLKKPV